MNNQKLSREVSAVRSLYGLSQAAFGELLGLGGGQISVMEQKECEGMTPEYVAAVGKALLKVSRDLSLGQHVAHPYTAELVPSVDKAAFVRVNALGIALGARAKVEMYEKYLEALQAVMPPVKGDWHREFVAGLKTEGIYAMPIADRIYEGLKAGKKVVVLPNTNPMGVSTFGQADQQAVIIKMALSKAMGAALTDKQVQGLGLRPENAARVVLG